MSKDEQIAAAKKQVEGLKAQLSKVTKEKKAGFDGVTDLVDDSMAKTFLTPKVRRSLKGHQSRETISYAVFCLKKKLR